MMNEAVSLSFLDAETNEEGLAVVRYDEHHIAICLSMKSGGDMEVRMKKDDGKRLTHALILASS